MCFPTLISGSLTSAETPYTERPFIAGLGDERCAIAHHPNQYRVQQWQTENMDGIEAAAATQRSFTQKGHVNYQELRVKEGSLLGCFHCRFIDVLLKISA